MGASKKPRALVVEDDAGWRSEACAILGREGFVTCEAGDTAGARKLATGVRPQLMVIDRKLPDGDGVRLLRDFRRSGLDSPAIIVTGHPSLDTAVEALGLDCVDYLVKPVNPHHLAARAKGLLIAPTIATCDYLWDSLRAKHDFDHVFSSDPLVQRCYAAAARVAHANVPALIEGETGVGKEYLSRAMHLMGPRAKGPFIAINCAALPETLLESELFGHERGAFTSAMAQKKGLAEEANGGTLFLDEIGEMSPTMQVKLLRFLEEGAFRRLGGTALVEVDVRIITATNKELLREVEAGRFREDLYYRVAVIPMYLPPLRERTGDIAVFARHFVARHVREQLALGLEAEAVLRAHSWPGNIRELHNVMRRAALLRQGDVLTAEDIRFGSIGRK
jgi:DNA-binding NtrC family response regulator